MKVRVPYWHVAPNFVVLVLSILQCFNCNVLEVLVLSTYCPVSSLGVCPKVLYESLGACHSEAYLCLQQHPCNWDA